MDVDLVGRQAADLIERHVDALHAEHGEACFAEIGGKGLVDVAAEIGRADELLDAQRLERGDVVSARGE
jgi:hypothetical protein